MKRFLCFMAALLIILGMPTEAARADEAARPTLPSEYVEGTTLKDEAINAVAAIVIDNQSGEVLYAKNADDVLQPASITKIMTCLLALEYAETTPDGLQEKVTVRSDWKAMRSDYSQIKVKGDEIYTLEQLLYGLMLPSGNDAAVVIAEHIDGSESAFADRMNAKAAELGMESSHFVNSHGITAEGHVVTARDMARLARAAMENETFRAIVATEKYKCAATNKRDARTWTNTNAFFGNSASHPELAWSPAIGIKTGYTNAAGMTFVGAAREGAREVICVVLGSPDTVTRFVVAKRLMQYGLYYYDTMDARQYVLNRVYTAIIPYAESSNPNATKAELEAGREFQVSLGLTEPIWLTLPAEEFDTVAADPALIRADLSLQPGLEAPLSEGQQIGEISVLYGDKLLVTGPVYITQNVARQEPAPDITPAPEEEMPAITGGNGNEAHRPGSGAKGYWIAAAVLAGVVLTAVIAGALVSQRKTSRSRHGSARRTDYHSDNIEPEASRDHRSIRQSSRGEGRRRRR
ncbi:MAG: D-alanyl-D-alanine carboxypeptidase family protein [Christensenellales bacterium]|jgi:D-alanyl-D-alanine carboxypeptidase